MKDHEIIIYAYKSFIGKPGSFWKILSNIIEYDQNNEVECGLISLFASSTKRYGAAVSYKSYRRPNIKDLNWEKEVIEKSLKNINQYRQNHWYWKPLKLKKEWED